MSLYDSIGFIQDGSLFITKNGWCCILAFVVLVLIFIRLTDLFFDILFRCLNLLKNWRRQKCDSKK